jgi:hypothetical protein
MNLLTWPNRLWLRFLSYEVHREGRRIDRALHTTTDPVERSYLLDVLADIQTELAYLHRAGVPHRVAPALTCGPPHVAAERGARVAPGHDDVDPAKVLDRAAELLSMLAHTEKAIEDGCYRRLGELRAGDRFWDIDRWAQISQIAINADTVSLRLDGSEQIQTWPAEDLVRTGAPPISVEEEVAAFHRDGITHEELQMWGDLTMTPDRQVRAALLDQLAELAAARVGQAADVLTYQAEIERHVAVDTTPTRRSIPTRRIIAGVSMLAGAGLVLSDRTLRPLLLALAAWVAMGAALAVARIPGRAWQWLRRGASGHQLRSTGQTGARNEDRPGGDR